MGLEQDAWDLPELEDVLEDEGDHGAGATGVGGGGVMHGPAILVLRLRGRACERAPHAPS